MTKLIVSKNRCRHYNSFQKWETFSWRDTYSTIFNSKEMVWFDAYLWSYCFNVICNCIVWVLARTCAYKIVFFWYASYTTRSQLIVKSLSYLSGITCIYANQCVGVCSRQDEITYHSGWWWKWEPMLRLVVHYFTDMRGSSAGLRDFMLIIHATATSIWGTFPLKTYRACFGEVI